LPAARAITQLGIHQNPACPLLVVPIHARLRKPSNCFSVLLV
jgi:hypothetical protein